MLVIYACAVSGLKTGKDFRGYVGQFPAFEPDASFPLLKPADSFPRRLTPVASFPRLAPICSAFGTGKF